MYNMALQFMPTLEQYVNVQMFYGLCGVVLAAIILAANEVYVRRNP